MYKRTEILPSKRPSDDPRGPGDSELSEDLQTRQDLYQRELETILRFGAMVNSSLDIQEVLDHAMKWAEEFMNAAASSVYELDEDKGELFVRLARGDKKGPVQGMRIKVGEGVAGHVVATGKAVMVEDTSSDARFSDKVDRLTGFKTESMLCVPLIVRDRPVGALQVINKNSGGPFTREDLKLLTAMGHQAAVALENAKFYLRLQEKFELTEKELQKTQAKLLRIGRLNAMGHLVRGVAHEIRNPIMTIGGFARRIKDRAREDESLSRYTDIILEETSRLENLVRRVHEFSEVQSANPGLNRIEAVIEETYHVILKEARVQGVEVLLSMDDDIPLLNIDCPQMAKALYNICRNALEAMPGGGKMEIRVTRPDESFVEITVADTGRGIPEEQMESVYNPFVTSKTRGTGLGLTMAHQIVTNHQGEIRIRSKENEGTTVTILIPVPPRPPSEAPDPNAGD